MTIKPFAMTAIARHTREATSNVVAEDMVSNDALKQILLKMGVKPSHVEIAMRRAEQQGESLAKIMRDFSFVSGEGVAQALSTQTGFPYFPLERLDTVDKAKLSAIEVPTFASYIPVDVVDGELLVAVSDTSDVVNATNKYRDYRPKVVLASEHTIQTAYRKYFAKTAEAVDIAIAEFMVSNDLSARQDDLNITGPLRKAYYAIIRHACYAGASDIYLDRSEFVGYIKLKINGVGTLFRTMDIALYDRIMNKLVQDNTKADELKQRPREAVVKLKEEDALEYPDIANRFNMRLELSESRGIRSAVIRILDKNANATDLERLGLDDYTYKKIAQISRAPTGFFIITGPTGSGKTTTMYAVIKKIDPVERSIQSIENPIEYEHGLWTQFELRKDAQDEGDEYNEWLKALLRNAPDVILIGEVRDKGVARICLNAANTGHLVFASLHTNTAPLAIVRLRDLEVDMNALSSVLLGVLGQRLVRLLCNHCKVPDDSVETQERINAFNTEKQVYRTYKAGDGCVNCDFTGYRGRSMVYELFEMNAETRILLEKDASPTEIAMSGLPVEKSMWACGLRLIQRGATSLEELENRVPYSDVEFMLKTRKKALPPAAPQPVVEVAPAEQEVMAIGHTLQTTSPVVKAPKEHVVPPKVDTQEPVRAPREPASQPQRQPHPAPQRQIASEGALAKAQGANNAAAPQRKEQPSAVEQTRALLEAEEPKTTASEGEGAKQAGPDSSNNNKNRRWRGTRR